MRVTTMEDGAMADVLADLDVRGYLRDAGAEASEDLDRLAVRAERERHERLNDQYRDRREPPRADRAPPALLERRRRSGSAGSSTAIAPGDERADPRGRLRPRGVLEAEPRPDRSDVADHADRLQSAGHDRGSAAGARRPRRVRRRRRPRPSVRGRGIRRRLAHHMLYHVDDRPKAFARDQRAFSSPAARFHASDERAGTPRELARSLRDRSLFARHAGHFGARDRSRRSSSRSSVDIEVERFDGRSSRVTEVEPVLAYIRSSFVYDGAPLDDTAAIGREAIDREGAFRIQTKAGRDSAPASLDTPLLRLRADGCASTSAMPPPTRVGRRACSATSSSTASSSRSRTASGYRQYGLRELNQLRSLAELRSRFGLGIGDIAFAAPPAPRARAPRGGRRLARGHGRHFVPRMGTAQARAAPYRRVTERNRWQQHSATT